VRDGGSLANLRLTRNAPLAGGAFAAALLGLQKREAECLRALHARIAESRSAWEARSSRTVPPAHVAVDAHLAVWIRASPTGGWCSARARTKEERRRRSRHSLSALAVGAAHL